MRRECKHFIQDIYAALQHIKVFVGKMTRKKFLADEKTRSAVAFKIENIGEASKNIPKEIRSKYKEIPWTEMARMRDKITHFYFGIDYKIVWSVVKKELPTLELVIAKVLNDMKVSATKKKTDIKKR
jgi:uncharacterized protein with HEPN domain